MPSKPEVGRMFARTIERYLHAEAVSGAAS
jgi:hypothetical protein